MTFFCETRALRMQEKGRKGANNNNQDHGLDADSEWGRLQKRLALLTTKHMTEGGGIAEYRQP